MIRDVEHAAKAQAVNPATTQPVPAVLRDVGSAHLILGGRWEGFPHRLVDRQGFSPSVIVFAVASQHGTVPVVTSAPQAARWR